MVLFASIASAQTGADSGAAINGSPNVMRGLAPPPPCQTAGDSSKGAFLSGRVAVEDGSASPSEIAIEMVCSNLRLNVAFTDSKGRFTFTFGGAANASDASAFGQRSSNPLLGISSGDAATALRTIVSCDIRASLPGDQSDEVSLTDHRVLDHSDVGAILLHRVFAVEGVAVSSTSLRAPKRRAMLTSAA